MRRRYSYCFSSGMDVEVDAGGFGTLVFLVVFLDLRNLLYGLSDSEPATNEFGWAFYVSGNCSQ